MAVTGPDFVSLQVRELERSAAFYERSLWPWSVRAGLGVELAPGVARDRP